MNNNTALYRPPFYGSALLTGFFVLFVSFSAPVFAEKTQKTPFKSLPGSVPLADSSRIMQKHELNAGVPDSLRGGSSSGQTQAEIPEGFVTQKLKKGESLARLCGEDSVCQTIFMKVNRVDKRHFPVGKTVLLPVDLAKAVQYAPIPELLTDSRGEREIRVYLNSQYFGAYEKGKLVFWGPVSTGRKTYATPPGRFFVNYKQRHKRSIKYDNAPMPFSINFYGGYFMHQQSLPGYPASHGCVRLLMTDAERLFNWVKLRDPVTVVRNGA